MASNLLLYCFGKKFVLPYRIIYIASIGVGDLCAMSLVWHLSDIFNFLISMPNLLSILMLSPHLKKLVRAYKFQLKKQKKSSTLTIRNRQYVLLLECTM